MRWVQLLHSLQDDVKGLLNVSQAGFRAWFQVRGRSSHFSVACRYTFDLFVVEVLLVR